MRNSSLTPSPLRRSGTLKRTRLSKRSQKTADLYRNERVPLVQKLLAKRPYCEAAKAGAPGECFGGLSVHEVLPRGRGGSITDEKNCRVCCIGHNGAISNDVETMKWATEHGFLRRA